MYNKSLPHHHCQRDSVSTKQIYVAATQCLKEHQQIRNSPKTDIDGTKEGNLTFKESTIAPNFANVLTALARTVAFSSITRL